MSPISHNPIGEQVRLPLSVAFGVVLQGIRIRFGRSVVTILGVVFGIAFLMSILTGQALRRGVAQEDALRAEVLRMRNFLAAEMGPPGERTLGVILLGDLNAPERRLLQRLEGEGITALRWVGMNGATLDETVFNRLEAAEVPRQELGREASAIMLMGEGALPALDWGEILAGMRQRVVAPTRLGVEPEVPGEVAVVALERAMRPDEIERQAAEARRNAFRDTWIVVISLLVTVIGISNAMLMSVTERFREIGTMKCLGALSSFVRSMFLIESALMGISGGIIGCLGGLSFSLLAYSVTYGFGLTFLSFGAEIGRLSLYLLFSLLAGVVLSVLAALYPASVASRMVPANALRSNV